LDLSKPLPEPVADNALKTGSFRKAIKVSRKASKRLSIFQGQPKIPLPSPKEETSAMRYYSGGWRSISAQLPTINSAWSQSDPEDHASTPTSELVSLDEPREQPVPVFYTKAVFIPATAPIRGGRAGSSVK
jgi:hypothetical protein